MAATAVVDTGFLVALVRRRDRHHAWAVRQAEHFATPWHTCESVLSEAFYVIPAHGWRALIGLLERGAVTASFDFSANRSAVLGIMRKYADLPVSLADACLVRMSELLPDPVVLTTDLDFGVYRRNNRQVVPVEMP